MSRACCSLAPLSVRRRSPSDGLGPIVSACYDNFLQRPDSFFVRWRRRSSTGSVGHRLLVAIAPGDLPRLQSAHVAAGSCVCPGDNCSSVGYSVRTVPAWRTSVPDLHTTLNEGESRSATARAISSQGARGYRSHFGAVLLCGAGLLIKTLETERGKAGFCPERSWLPSSPAKSRYRTTCAKRPSFTTAERSNHYLRSSAGGTSNLPLKRKRTWFFSGLSRGGDAPNSSFRLVFGL